MEEYVPAGGGGRGRSTSPQLKAAMSNGERIRSKSPPSSPIYLRASSEGPKLRTQINEISSFRQHNKVQPCHKGQQRLVYKEKEYQQILQPDDRMPTRSEEVAVKTFETPSLLPRKDDQNHKIKKKETEPPSLPSPNLQEKSSKLPPAARKIPLAAMEDDEKNKEATTTNTKRLQRRRSSQRGSNSGRHRRRSSSNPARSRAGSALSLFAFSDDEDDEDSDDEKKSKNKNQMMPISLPQFLPSSLMANSSTQEEGENNEQEMMEERVKSGVAEGWCIDFRLKEMEKDIKRIKLQSDSSNLSRYFSPMSSDDFSVEDVLSRVTHVEDKIKDLNKARSAKSSVYNPCKCFVKSQDKETISSARLVKNVWTAAFIAPLVDSDPMVRWQLVVPQYIGLILTVIAQITLISFIYKWTIHAEHTTCARGSGVMRSLCLCIVYSIVATSDFNDLSIFRRWLRYVPKWIESGHRPQSEHHQTYLAILRIQNGEEEAYALATGISDTYFYFSYWVLTVPQFFLAVITLGVVSGYIVYADTNEGIVVHTLISLLIFQIDAFAYNYLTGQPVKDALEGLPPLGLLATFDKNEDERNAKKRTERNSSVHRTIASGCETVAFDSHHQDNYLKKYGYRFYAFKDDKRLQNLDGIVLLPLMILVVLIAYSSWCWDRNTLLYVTLAGACFITIIFGFSSIMSKFQSEPVDAQSYLDLHVSGKVYTSNHEQEEVAVPVPAWYTFFTGKRFEDGHLFDPNPQGTARKKRLHKITLRREKKKRQHEKKADRAHKRFFDAHHKHKFLKNTVLDP